MPLLTLDKVTKAFGALRAVDNVSFEISERCLCAIIGPNGAGKTTLFNLISGKLFPTEGKIRFKGTDITKLPPYKRVRIGIGRSFQITNIFPELTVEENLRVALYSKLRKTSVLFKEEGSIDEINRMTGELISILGLEDKRNVLCTNLSHADQRIIEIGLTVALDPELLLLDEPTAGMSRVETIKTVEFIKQLANMKGLTLILTEHDMGVVFSIAERIIVMHQGRVIADGPPEEVKQMKVVQEAYLGE